MADDTGGPQVKVSGLRKRHRTLLNERVSFVSDWRTLAEYFQPKRFRALDEDGTSKTNDGDLLDTLITNESVRAMRVLAAGMQGGMTSPARPWFRLGVPDNRLEEDKAVKEWLAQVQRILLNVMARSNFYDSIHQLYAELGTFGTGCMFVLEDFDHVVRFKTLTAGSYCLIPGPEGRITGAFRILNMTAEQMVERFGETRCSDAVRTAARDDGTKDTWFQAVHVVLPNQHRKPEKIDGQEKGFLSYYYEYAKASVAGSSQLLAFGGYHEQPFAGPRWDIVGADTYGRGPGHDTLNDVRQLQSMTTTLLKALHKQADPPVVAPSNMFDVNTVPGGVNYVDTTNRDGLRALYDVRFDVNGTAAMIEQVKGDIREGLYNDLFKMLALSERNNITATEVRQRIEEKLILLGPVIERLHAELLDIIIDRTFGICLRKGVLPPPPPVLEGKELKVEYISLLAQAQKMIGTSAIDQFMALIGSYAPIFPEMVDIPDVDQVGESYAEMLGVDPKLVRAKSDRDDLRQARQQAAAAQQQMEQAQAGAGIAKDVGQSGLADGGQSAVDSLTGGLVQQ